MTRCILIISITVFFFSCKESIPFGIIKPAKMQQVLWDVLRADALSHEIVKIDPSKSLSDENIKLTKKVFLIHNITEEQFQKSYSYYTQHPDKMKTMLDSLNVQQVRKNTIVPEKPKQVITESSRLIMYIK
jgi:hypothetical protein